MRATAPGRLQREAAGVGIQVQHPGPRGQLTDPHPGRPLIEEHAGLLAYQRLDLQPQAVLLTGHLGGGVGGHGA
jgi:hypothetical protein